MSSQNLSPESPFTRRTLLTGLFGGCALSVATAGFVWMKVGYSLEEGEDPLVLSVKEVCVLRALFAAFSPKGGDLPSPRSLQLLDRVDEELWSASLEVRDDFEAALLLIEHTPPLLGYGHRLSRLPGDSLGPCLHRMLRSDRDSIVAAVMGMKQLVHLLTYGQPGAWTPIGYDGPWVLAAVPPPTHPGYLAAKEKRT